MKRNTHPSNCIFCKMIPLFVLHLLQKKVKLCKIKSLNSKSFPLDQFITQLTIRNRVPNRKWGNICHQNIDVLVNIIERNKKQCDDDPFLFFPFPGLNETLQKQYQFNENNINHQQHKTSNTYNHLSNPSSDSRNATKKAPSNSSPINIHIEVDIDPPAEQPQLSPEELQSLGLPATHVHYDINKQLTSSADSHEELLAPSDIKVTYSEGEAAEEQPLRDKLLTSVASAASGEDEAYENYAHFTSDLYGTPEPPRALPLHHNGDISDRIPHGNPPLSDDSRSPSEDTLYSIEAQCDLQCGRGTCHLEKIDKDRLKKRCLCPLGTSGENCALGKSLL